MAGHDLMAEVEALRERASFYEMEARYASGEAAAEGEQKAQRLRGLAQELLDAMAAPDAR